MAIDAMQSPPAGLDSPGGADPDDESMDDGTAGDGLPADDNNTPDKSVTFPPELAASAGLGDLKVGDSFMVTIKGTVTDSTDGTLTADVEDALNGMKTAGDSAQQPPSKKPMQRVLSPKEAGFGDDDESTGL